MSLIFTIHYSKLMTHNTRQIYVFSSYIGHLGPSPTTCFKLFDRIHRTLFSYFLSAHKRLNNVSLKVQNGTQVAESLLNTSNVDGMLTRFFFHIIPLWSYWRWWKGFYDFIEDEANQANRMKWINALNRCHQHISIQMKQVE